MSDVSELLACFLDGLVCGLKLTFKTAPSEFIKQLRWHFVFSASKHKGQNKKWGRWIVEGSNNKAFYQKYQTNPKKYEIKNLRGGLYSDYHFTKKNKK